MADIENFSEINQNFDTIKTLLNSIRAQGILNTSDVDKLLSGINNKLEKINTEEDIDMIKIFLSELKQNLDERHNVLVSKFGAIEALFTNLLKNSSEMPKSSDIKELFDIVATNLSVFSREVVSQKETLTDITLRIDALRSDDSQKKDIIKNIALLKPDLERLNNGFDSIVISLNDNFKTIVKTISTIDKTEYLDRFADNLKNIEMSSNTVLSALQVIDKKAEKVDESLQNVATKDDIRTQNKNLFELKAQAQEISTSVASLSGSYLKLDSLSDKIDASVSIIASLKSGLDEKTDTQTKELLEKLQALELKLHDIASDTQFEELKKSIEVILNGIAENYSSLDNSLSITSQELRKITSVIEALGIDTNFSKVLSSVEKIETDVKSSINEVADKLVDLQDANITRVLNDITTSTETLSTKLNQSQTEVALLCEKNFGSVYEKITDLKTLLSQLDENSVSANNAIFSSITDRLSVFENCLRDSLDLQEKSVNNSSAELSEQIENIKNISNVLDYKMDASVVEVGNIKREFDSLKTAVENVLALDFVTVVKDLRVDLYASKQEITDNLETAGNDLTEKFANDLFGKYELLISKLDAVTDEINGVQSAALTDVKAVLENISSSIVDVLSYVSEIKPATEDANEAKIARLADTIKENSLNYIDEVQNAVDVIRVKIEENLNKITSGNLEEFDSIKRSVSEHTEDVKREIKFSYSKLLELQESYNELKETLNMNNIAYSGKIDGVIASADSIKSEINEKLAGLKTSVIEKVSEFKQEFACENANKVSELKSSVENFQSKTSQEFVDVINELKEQWDNLNTDNNTARAGALAKILDNFASIKDYIKNLNDSNAEVLSAKINEVLADFDSVKSVLNKVDENIDGDMTRQLSIIESNFEALVSQITILFDKSDKSMTDKINEEFTSVSQKMDSILSDKLDNYKTLIDKTFDDLSEKTTVQTQYIKDCITDINTSLKSIWETQAEENSRQFEEIAVSMKNIIDENVKLTAVDYVALKNKLIEFANSIETNNQLLMQELQKQTDTMLQSVISSLESNFQILSTKSDYLKKQEKEDYLETYTLLNSLKSLVEENSSHLQNITNNIQTTTEGISDKTDAAISDITVIKDNLSTLKQLYEENSSSFANSIDSNNQQIIQEVQTQAETAIQSVTSAVDDKFQVLSVKTEEMLKQEKKDFLENYTMLSSLKSLTQDEFAGIKSTSELIQTQAQEISDKTDSAISEISLIKDALTAIKQVYEESSTSINTVNSSIIKTTEEFKSHISEISSESDLRLQNIFDKLTELLSEEKQHINVCKDLTCDLLTKNINLVSQNIEKETDVIIAEIVEQFDILKKSQADDVINLTSRIEEIISSQIYTNIEDLKSYLDVKTNNIDINSKLDNLKSDMTSSVDEIVNNISKLLDTEVFTTSIEDFRVASELFVNSAIDRVNARIQSFIEEYGDDIRDKLALFDKKFIDTLTDKFEEIKLLSNEYNKAFESLQKSFENMHTDIYEVKTYISEQISALNDTIKTSSEATNNEVRLLNECFENLRSQISNRSFDEELQCSINKQISSLENLIKEQLSYVEDINELCANSLPDVTELNTLVKQSILEAIKDFSKKIDEQNIEQNLNQLKSDIITQILNVFNQISFVAEQEEILDFIQEKHEELITILSHIITTTADVTNVKNRVQAVDNKIDDLKDEIALINNKISSIISSEGDIDYVYSLQELETDIAGLRLALNEMNKKHNSQELSDLVASTNEIYNLVELIKKDLPNKSDFENIAEDIISISTRTNKLILASDESYKTLQDNLQDFKLVINDLDERTKNFAQESGMDKIDSKLNAINTMVTNGAKTNQVFNQVFEYLAEWVDNASVQINAISDKVETLDDIGQIKVMLADLKAEAEDNSESVELIEALSSVFEKQTKRISALEAKLDKIIVETTINNKNNKIDLAPIEATLNRFLVAMDDKMSEQQSKIDSLESKLEGVKNLIDDNNTTQLTKKVGGMDRQIAKLNKNIEKIASHVVEK